MTPAQLLDFEATHTRHSGAKEELIRELGLKPARYYVLLHRAATSRDGMTHDPITARRAREREEDPHLVHTRVGVFFCVRRVLGGLG